MKSFKFKNIRFIKKFSYGDEIFYFPESDLFCIRQDPEEVLRGRGSYELCKVDCIKSYKCKHSNTIRLSASVTGFLFELINGKKANRSGYSFYNSFIVSCNNNYPGASGYDWDGYYEYFKNIEDALTKFKKIILLQ